MSKRDRRKHTDADRIRYMHMLEEGKSINSIHRKYGIGDRLLTVLWEKYKRGGEEAIKKAKNCNVMNEEKKQIVREIESNNITLVDTSMKYGPSVNRIQFWLSIARQKGIDALDAIKAQGRPKDMERPKKKAIEEMTELERLQKENLELRTENALLKKEKALVEERNARLKEIGHGPLKN